MYIEIAYILSFLNVARSDRVLNLLMFEANYLQLDEYLNVVEDSNSNQFMDALIMQIHT